MSDTDEQEPKQPQLMDKKLLLSVPKVATAIVIVTGFILLLGGNVVAGYGAVVAFVLAIAFSIFEAKYDKVLANHGPMGIISAIINAASIFVASAGINSSLASVVGGTETSFGKFVQPWFTPVAAKASIDSLGAQVKVADSSKKEITGQLEEFKLAGSAPVTTTSNVPEIQTEEQLNKRRQAIENVDKIAVSDSKKQAQALLDKGERKFFITVRNPDNTTRRKEVTAESTKELQDSIDYYGQRYRGWYVVLNNARSERELKPRLDALTRRISNDPALTKMIGARPNPEIWPPTKTEGDNSYKLIALFGVKDKLSAENARVQLVNMGYTNAELMRR